MKTLKSGIKDSEVKTLCKYLGLTERTLFDSEVLQGVKEYQKEKGLTADGIVGPLTWKSLYINNIQPGEEVKDEDYTFAASLLGCEVKALKAVVKVETGGRGGFIADGLPQILFEGHIFWKELKARGIDPNSIKGHSEILYPSWDKTKYKGGIKEWDRLNEAIGISEEAALSSASWGLFQIMGNNYKAAGKGSVKEFVEENKKSEVNQFFLGISFIQSSTKILNALKKKDWATFARYYNGSGQVFVYSNRLKEAYKTIK